MLCVNTSSNNQQNCQEATTTTTISFIRCVYKVCGMNNAQNSNVTHSRNKCSNKHLNWMSFSKLICSSYHIIESNYFKCTHTNSIHTQTCIKLDEYEKKFDWINIQKICSSFCHSIWHESTVCINIFSMKNM